MEQFLRPLRSRNRTAENGMQRAVRVDNTESDGAALAVMVFSQLTDILISEQIKVAIER